MLRHQFIRAMRQIDERYGNYGSDLDLCAQVVRRASKKVRIVCNVKVGDKLTIGDTYGLIRYGSRLDTYLPVGSNVLITTGQRTLAGETVLAELP